MNIYARIKTLIFLVLVSYVVSYAGAYDSDSVRKLFDGRLCDPIEGVWEFPGDGAVICITRTTRTTYDVLLLDSPRLDLAPGVKIGQAVSSPKKGLYDGRLDSSNLGKAVKIKHTNVTFNVEGDYLTIKGYSTGITVSLRGWLYKLFRITIKDNNKRPGNLDGARKIYPVDQSTSTDIVL